MRMRFAAGVVLAAALLLAGCSLAPTYERPSLDLPENWQKTDGEENLSVQWWKRFGDPVLDSLVEEAFASNKNLEAAMARVNQARAALGLAYSDMAPSVTGSGSAQTGYVNGDRVYGPSGAEYTNFRLSLGASWEPDLWGKYRNAAASAKADLLASEASWQGLRLSLAGETVKAYFLLLTLDTQIAIAERTLDSRLKTLDLFTEKYRWGLLSELDLTQVRTLAETAKTSLAQLRAARENGEGALAVLLGRSPKEIFGGRIVRSGTIDALPGIPVLPKDMPSNLLERRPDIVAAEQNLIAANADIGVARAAWMPSLSLSSALGLADFTDLSNLLAHAHTRFGTIGGSVGMPIFDFGRILARVRASEARKMEMAAAYEQTVQQAFADVRSAFSNQYETEKIVVSAEVQVREYGRALKLARDRYEAGTCSHLEVLDAERSLFAAELDLAQSRNDRLAAVVALCLALGGGWTD
ncbi:MAG: efflux transporter outer membrane subunit [Desulfovibrionaceae bacterium]|nr:efflux transporter outer membrane subunit [Desulfovibrionaceae bacterium]